MLSKTSFNVYRISDSFVFSFMSKNVYRMSKKRLYTNFLLLDNISACSGRCKTALLSFQQATQQNIAILVCHRSCSLSPGERDRNLNQVFTVCQASALDPSLQLDAGVRSGTTKVSGRFQFGRKFHFLSFSKRQFSQQVHRTCLSSRKQASTQEQPKTMEVCFSTFLLLFCSFRRISYRLFSFFAQGFTNIQGFGCPKQYYILKYHPLDSQWFGRLGSGDTFQQGRGNGKRREEGGFRGREGDPSGTNQ